MGLLLYLIMGLITLLAWLAGIAVVIQSYEDLRTGLSSRKWNPVEAVVTDHIVRAYTTGKASTTAYGYLVMYTYSVERQTYRGSGFDHDDFAEWESAEQASIADYPVGKVVEIFHNSYNPEISSSRTSSEQIASALFELCGGSFFMGGIAGFTNQMATALEMPFLQIGTFIIMIAFWCLMLSIISSILIDCFKEVKNQRLPRPALGFFIFLFLFGVLSTHLIGGLMQLVGIVLIGSAPAKGCYQPNFQEKRWISISCPSRGHRRIVKLSDPFKNHTTTNPSSNYRSIPRTKIPSRR
jgi:Protein of unknown function (DUF3592)